MLREISLVGCSHLDIIIIIDMIFDIILLDLNRAKSINYEGPQILNCISFGWAVKHGI